MATASSSVHSMGFCAHTHTPDSNTGQPVSQPPTEPPTSCTPRRRWWRTGGSQVPVVGAPTSAHCSTGLRAKCRQPRTGTHTRSHDMTRTHPEDDGRDGPPARVRRDERGHHAQGAAVAPARAAERAVQHRAPLLRRGDIREGHQKGVRTCIGSRRHRRAHRCEGKRGVAWCNAAGAAGTAPHAGWSGMRHGGHVRALQEAPEHTGLFVRQVLAPDRHWADITAANSRGLARGAAA